ncbi:hypothetical protein C2E25_15785 [Geothermobacter hydrogeniphilus]|uniref:DUF3617 family protein n=1 Tax=Geothermobacter hydrogeniphilus TaxID=1969733 RepID=A0A2K2H642_9BACT|nr:DUF3617 family protein [Geothermobacter hydrogeniphilus]PNU18792.1 hypothetical protein C2E25_15785 [Geothermobacter hydrogeniphilus]
MKRTLIFAALFLLATTASAADPNLAGSRWSIETTIMVPGMAPMPGGKFDHCFDDSGVPYQEEPGQDCKIVHQQRSGNKVSWEIRCKGEDGASSMKGVSTYQGDSMTSDVEMIADGHTMKMKMKGKRLGPCQ